MVTFEYRHIFVVRKRNEHTGRNGRRQDGLVEQGIIIRISAKHKACSGDVSSVAMYTSRQTATDVQHIIKAHIQRTAK